MAEIARWALVVIMAGHGLIHIIGAFGELGIAKPPQIVPTIFPLNDEARRLLGAIWLIPLILFLLSSVGLAMNLQWWSMTAVFAIVVSQALIIIWWPGAKFGTIPNVLVVLGILLL